MRICFDIDGVLCSQVDKDYKEAQPNKEMIDLVNRLYAQGHTIVLHTSRFMGRTNQDKWEAELVGRDFTTKQLDKWGVKYHQLWMGKPKYDVVIDDRSVFYNSDVLSIEAFLQSRMA